nr:MAG TPA: hypothetical protein [Caudoviricetes sp.]
MPPLPKHYIALLYLCPIDYQSIANYCPFTVLLAFASRQAPVKNETQ